jgi:Pentapeptide repeats (8 copies)
MSETEPSGSNSSPEPSASPRSSGSERVSLWISHARAFIRRRRAVLRVISVILGLGLVAFLLRSPARDHKRLAKVRDAFTAGSQILADPSHLPELLFGVALVVVFTLWWLPKWQATRSPGLSDENRFDRENEARKTLAQIIGGAFLLAGLYSSVQSFNLQQQGQITDRYTKAIEQLGAMAPGGPLDANGNPSINLAVRLGGIYALERIAQDSPRDYWTIMQVLATYVRVNSPVLAEHQAGSAPDQQHPPSRTVGHPSDSAIKQPRLRADVQAILTVIGNRNTAQDPWAKYLDLSYTNLIGAHLEGADLRGVHLEHHAFNGTNFKGAHLEDAHLNSSSFTNLTDFAGAHLDGAHFADIGQVGGTVFFRGWTSPMRSASPIANWPE